MFRVGDKVKVKPTNEVMEIRSILCDGDILVGVWDCGCWMVKSVNSNEIEKIELTLS